MKHFFLFILLSSFSLLVSCREEEVVVGPVPIPVTYYSISGTWQLVEYCGSVLPEGTCLTLDIDRKEHTVQMTGNLNSAYATTRLSTFEISGDDYYGYTLTGSYGAVAGDWQYSYLVQLYDDGSMYWTAVGHPSYTQRFVRH